MIGQFVVLDEDARLGGVERAHHRQDDEGENPCPDGEAENRGLGAPQRPAKRREVDILCYRVGVAGRGQATELLGGVSH